MILLSMEFVTRQLHEFLGQVHVVVVCRVFTHLVPIRVYKAIHKVFTYPGDCLRWCEAREMVREKAQRFRLVARPYGG